jgi:hypothetical protein
VTLYSRAKLTKHSDKLVALSGLAHAVQRESGDQYVAGLWRKDLEYSLLWSIYTDDRMMCRPQPYRAPTVSMGHIYLT